MSEESGKSGKIPCANCLHCKLLKTTADDGEIVEKVRCAAGHWKKMLGEEKLYKYATVNLRMVDSCNDYIPMGDSRIFIKELKKILPKKGNSRLAD